MRPLYNELYFTTYRLFFKLRDILYWVSSFIYVILFQSDGKVCYAGHEANLLCKWFQTSGPLVLLKKWSFHLSKNIYESTNISEAIQRNSS